MKQCLSIIMLFLLSSCSEKKEEKNTESNTEVIDSSFCTAGMTEDSIDTKDGAEEDIKLWVDSLAQYYVDNTKNDAIRNAIKKDLGVAWMWGEVETRDSVLFLICKVGRNGEDRFETYQWLYIDTTTRTIYEYDVAEDALTKWKAK